MSRIRFVPVLVFLLATVVVLFGGWIAYRDYGLVRPLKQQLAATQNVQTVETVNLSGPQREIEVSMKKVPDLQTAYRSIKSAVSSKLKTDIAIKIKDQRTPELEAAFQSYQPLIYSGIAQGNYMDMIEKFQTHARKDGFTKANVTMDRENLYIQLEKGDNFLYEVIPYRSDSSLPQQGVKSI